MLKTWVKGDRPVVDKDSYKVSFSLGKKLDQRKRGYSDGTLP